MVPKVAGREVTRIQPFYHGDAGISLQPCVHLAMTDIDCGYMGCTAFQEHLGETTGRRADVEGVAFRGVKAEMIQAGDELQRSARHITLCRVVRHDRCCRRYGLAGLQSRPAIDGHSPALDRVPRPRAAVIKTTPDEKLVKPQARWFGWAGIHRPSLAKAWSECKDTGRAALPPCSGRPLPTARSRDARCGEAYVRVQYRKRRRPAFAGRHHLNTNTP